MNPVPLKEPTRNLWGSFPHSLPGAPRQVVVKITKPSHRPEGPLRPSGLCLLSVLFSPFGHLRPSQSCSCLILSPCFSTGRFGSGERGSYCRGPGPRTTMPSGCSRRSGVCGSGIHRTPLPLEENVPMQSLK